MANILWQPNPGSQAAFLSSIADEVLFGGALGGGKTDALIVMPTRRAVHPKHRSIFLRRERKRLQEAIDRARFLYPLIDPAGEWHETELRWKWSSGAFTQFGYAQHEKDVEAFKTFEFDLVMFDELTEWTEWQYKFMFTRARSKVADFKPWIRSATNPGGPGMEWVDARFIGWQADGTTRYEPWQTYEHRIELEDGEGRPLELKRTRQYIPATIFDNPRLPNRDEYLAGVAELDPEERKAYLYGQWGRFKGQFFTRLPREVAPGYKHRDWYIIRCADYGYDDPFAMYWLVVYPALGIVEIAAEVYHKEQSTYAIAQLAAATERALRVDRSRLRWSVISPDVKKKGTDGGQSVQTLLADRGLFFELANPDRQAGWNRIRELINRDILRVWKGQAPNLMRTLPRLQRHKDKPDDITPRSKIDHAAEALRYGVMCYWDKKGEAPKAPEERQERKDPYWDELQRSLKGPKREYVQGLGVGW